MPFDQNIGARIRQLRERAGLGQSALGDMLGVDQSAISRIEKGERQITAQELLILSNDLGMSIEEIISPEAEQPILLRSADGADGREAFRLLGQCIDEFRGLQHLDS